MKLINGKWGNSLPTLLFGNYIKIETNTELDVYTEIEIFITL